MASVSTGVLGQGCSYLAVGDGPPLVQVLSLTPTHEALAGMERRMALSNASPFSNHYRVYVVKLKKGLQPGESMSDIARHVASAIEEDIGEPVLLTGTSTGGSVALQLSVDHPDLVRALVMVASAYRLGPGGRQIQQELARRTRAGDAASGFAQMTSALLPSPLGGMVYPVARMMWRTMVPTDPADMLVTLDAEDVFDVGDQLERVTAPTLVIGGDRDVLYSRELFEQTAAGVRDGRAHIYPGWGHFRTSSSSTTANLALGFLFAATDAR